MKMKVTSLILLFTSMPFMTGYAVANEGSVGNGGFAYKKPIALLKMAKDHLEGNLQLLDETQFNKDLATKGLPPIQFSKLIALIKNIRMSFLKNELRADHDGLIQPLLMNYGTDATGDYIEALQPFFVGNIMTKVPICIKVEGAIVTRLLSGCGPNDLREVEKVILHEAVHHFGYDEKMADAFERFYHMRQFVRTVRGVQN